MCATMNERWDRHFLHRCLLVATMSKDPSTKVGAVLARPGVKEGLERTPPIQIADGFNGFPRGVADTPERLANRDLKLKMIVHAERNALLNAARVGASTEGSTLYFVALNTETKRPWGGPCCSACAIEAIQAGVRRVVTVPAANVPERWRADLDLSRCILAEAGIHVEEIPWPE